MTDKPLKGVKVIDFGVHAAGSACGKVLADWGADVIKVEGLSGCPTRVSGMMLGLDCEPGHNIHFEMLNGNKRSIAVNMKTPEGREIMERLLAQANIFFSNYRLNGLKRMGLDYESLSQRHPHIIWGHLSGYGVEGPQSGDPGFDVVCYWARSGLLMDIAEKDTMPTTGPIGIGDFNTGASLAGALAACLYQQLKTGKGQKVMNSLYGTAVWTAGSEVQSSMHGDIYPRSRRNATSPLINSYRCRDGQWLVMCSMDYGKVMPLLCEMFGRPELAADPRFSSVKAMKEGDHCERLIDIFSACFAEYDFSQVDTMMSQRDIPHTRVCHFSDVANDPQAVANAYIYEFETRDGTKDIMVSTPIKFGGNKPILHRNAPLIGEHTREILRECGYREEEIDALYENQIVCTQEWTRKT